MYEYSIETLEIPTKMFKQVLKAKELDGLFGLINKKAEDGWELVTNTFMAAADTVGVQSFVCTFRREKKV